MKLQKTIALSGLCVLTLLTACKPKAPAPQATESAEIGRNVTPAEKVLEIQTQLLGPGRSLDPDTTRKLLGGLQQSSMTVREAVRAGAKSNAYRTARTANMPAEQAVRNLYRDLLGRDVDPSGLQYWSGIFAQSGPDKIIDALIDGQEYMSKFGDNQVPHS